MYIFSYDSKAQINERGLKNLGVPNIYCESQVYGPRHVLQTILSFFSNYI